MTFVSDNRRRALANAFRAFFGIFATVEIERIRALTDEAQVDEEFEKVEKQVRYVLQMRVVQATAAHRAVILSLSESFQKMVDAAGRENVSRKTENGHFAPAASLKQALDKAQADLDAFEKDMDGLKQIETRLLKASGGARPVRRAAA